MGFLDKLKAGLAKTKEGFLGQIKNVVKSFTRVDEDLLEELEELLICADIGVNSTEQIIDELRDRIKENRLSEQEDVMAALREIIEDMIGQGEPLKLGTKPSVILVIGVNGAGKTTSIGKISNILRQQGKKVVVAAADTFRAAAIEQLGVWCERSGVDMVKQSEGSDPAAVVYDAINYSKSKGLVLNKLDGTAKGGIVISIKQELGVPVKFIGVGEKIDDMQVFDADEFTKALFE